MLKQRGKTYRIQEKIRRCNWSRSTGATLPSLTHKEELEFLDKAALLHTQPKELRNLDTAVIAEVARIEADTGKQAAQRAENYFLNFQRWLGHDLPLNKIDTAMLERYQRDRLLVRSQATTRHEIDWVMRLLRMNGILIIKPPRRAGKVTEQRPFTTVELKLFFSHCKPFERTLFEFMLVTGARPAEVVPSFRSSHIALLKREIDSTQMTVLIRSAKVMKGKRGITRKVSIPKHLMNEVIDVARSHPGPTVFPPSTNTCRIFDRILYRARIDKKDELGRKLTAHSFRHTYATIAAEAVGSNAFLLKAILGHTQISTTDRYIHAQAPAVVIDSFALGVRGACSISSSEIKKGTLYDSVSDK